MRDVTGFEHRANERGRAIGFAIGLWEAQLEGLRDTIQAVLEVRFGVVDSRTLEELNSLTDFVALEAARAAVQTVDSVESLRQIWRNPPK